MTTIERKHHCVITRTNEDQELPTLKKWDWGLKIFATGQLSPLSSEPTLQSSEEKLPTKALNKRHPRNRKLEWLATEVIK